MLVAVTPRCASRGLFLTFGEYRLLAKEGATIGTAGVQAWVRGASGGCGASSDGDARIGLYERRPLVKMTMSTAATVTTMVAGTNPDEVPPGMNALND